VLIVLVK